MRVLSDPAKQARYLVRRKAELGLTDADFAAARNGGRTRTASKRALLKAIEDQAKSDGRKPPFATTV